MQREPNIPEMTRRQKLNRAAGKQLKHFAQGFRARMDEELKAHDITVAQVRLLREARERPGITGAQLARALGITPQSVQAMVARAVEQGWLLRGVDAQNSRLVTLQLTPPGARLLAQADLVARSVESDVWAGVTVAQMQVFRGVLERCLHNLAG